MRVALVVPGRLDTRTGGYIYDRRIVEGLRALGHDVDVVELAELGEAAPALAALPDGTVVLVDSLALGPLHAVVAAQATRLRMVALMHLPAAAAWGLEGETAARLAADERRALHAVTLVVVTGRATIELLAPYDIPRDRIVVVEPGTDGPPRQEDAARPKENAARTFMVRGSGVHLLCVATVNPGKGHELLLEALAEVPGGNWRLTCAGSVTRDPATAARVRDAVGRLGLEGRVHFAGDLEAAALAACYEEADVFVLATYQETWGMAVAEALAHGLPVVATRTGAIPDLVPDEAGLLVPAGERAALTAALSRVIADGRFRARLAAGARRAGERLPTWDQASRRMAAALGAVTGG